MFEEIKGQAAAKEYLTRALRDQRLPNTLLFTGPEGVGKKRMARALADKLLSHTKSDLHIMAPEGKTGLHTIETIRSSIAISHESPFEAKAKVFLIESAERMQPASANALLKTLEEPVLDSYWILITSKPQEILPTVLSRCVKVQFFPVQEAQTIDPQLEEAKNLLLIALKAPPAYYELFALLERIETTIETEDPVQYQHRAEALFVALAFELREKEGWSERFEQARLGFDRNIRLSTCLESFFILNLTN